MSVITDNAKVKMHTCDAVSVYDGKVSMLGGSWPIVGPQPSAMGVAVVIELPVAVLPQQFEWSVSLVDADGNSVVLGDPQGEHQHVGVAGGGQVEPPADYPALNVVIPLAMNFPPIPLAPGHYAWVLSINGETQEDWRTEFTFFDPNAQVQAPVQRSGFEGTDSATSFKF